MNARPVIGIVGSRGAYGRWLARFFAERMGLVVHGRDPAGDAAQLSEAGLIEACDVLLFAAPIRSTAALIRHYAALAAGREREQLWLDVTSIKRDPVAAMLGSQAEVVGLHPMAAPPKAPTLKGRVLIVSPARLQRWRGWVEQLLAALEADCVSADPVEHDQRMALVQAMVHASHIAQAALLAEAGGPAPLWPFRSVSFELDATVTSRILAGNPAIYRDIQFENPAVLPVLDRLQATLGRLRDAVAVGNEAARSQFDADLAQARAVFGDAELAAGNYRFERIGYLLADLADPRALSVFLPDDRPGALRALLAVFEQHAVNIESIHSSRTADGEVHFRIGCGAAAPARLAEVAAAIEAGGCGQVLSGV
jgi:prephenate dehydrogenase